MGPEFRGVRSRPARSAPAEPCAQSGSLVCAPVRAGQPAREDLATRTWLGAATIDGLVLQDAGSLRSGLAPFVNCHLARAGHSGNCRVDGVGYAGLSIGSAIRSAGRGCVVCCKSSFGLPCLTNRQPRLTTAGSGDVLSAVEHGLKRAHRGDCTHRIAGSLSADGRSVLCCKIGRLRCWMAPGCDQGAVALA